MEDRAVALIGVRGSAELLDDGVVGNDGGQRFADRDGDRVGDGGGVGGDNDVAVASDLKDVASLQGVGCAGRAIDRQRG